MDLFEEEELGDDTRAKLVHYEDEVQLPACVRDLTRSKKENLKESENEYYAGKPVSRSQLIIDESSEIEVDSESGRLYLDDICNLKWRTQLAHVCKNVTLWHLCYCELKVAQLKE